MRDTDRLGEALKQVRIVGEHHPDLRMEVDVATEAIKALSEEVEECEIDK